MQDSASLECIFWGREGIQKWDIKSILVHLISYVDDITLFELSVFLRNVIYHVYLFLTCLSKYQNLNFQYFRFEDMSSQVLEKIYLQFSNI